MLNVTNQDRAAWERYKSQEKQWRDERAQWENYKDETLESFHGQDNLVGDSAFGFVLKKVDGEIAGRVSNRLQLLNPLDGAGRESVFGRNDILPLNYLHLGVRAARAVCRIEVRDGAGRHLDFGTGFLVSHNLILTNQHVLRSAAEATRSLAEFDFEEDEDFRPRVKRTFKLDPIKFFHNDEKLDFALVAVEPNAQDGTPLTDYGILELIKDSGKALLDEPVTIVHHPNGGDKKITLRNNTILGLVEEFIQYSTDTLRGSSGSPVLNDQWQVVCLHHRAVGRMDDQSRYLTKNNRLWKEEMGEDAIDWVSNEGLRISELFKVLQSKTDWTPVQSSLLAEMGVRVRPASGVAPNHGAESLRTLDLSGERILDATPAVISLAQFNTLVDDPATTETDLAPYVRLDLNTSGAFAPIFRLDRGRVVDPRGLESDRALNWANGWCRRQRQREYRRRLATGNPAIKIVSEGDSWFQYPFILDDVIDHLMAEPDFAVCSLDSAGDLLSDMIANGEYLDALRVEQPAVFLISGGGNDMLGDERITNYLHVFQQGRLPADYLKDSFAQFLQDLGQTYRRLFAAIIDESPTIRVVCHGYDYAIPQNGIWLGRPMRDKLDIADRSLQAAIVRAMIDRVAATLAAVAGEFPQVTFLDLRNRVGGESEWYDELHPRSSGFKRIADRFIRAIRDSVG